MYTYTDVYVLCSGSICHYSSQRVVKLLYSVPIPFDVVKLLRLCYHHLY